MKRLVSFEVQKLFGALNHKVELELSRGITIIHGANGTGKTTLLRAVSQLTKTIPPSLLHLSFKDLRLNFEDNTSLVARKEERHLVLEQWENNKRKNTFSTKEFAATLKRGQHYEIVRRLIDKDITPLAGNEWFVSGRVVGPDELWEHVPISTFNSVSRQKSLFGEHQTIPDWLSDFWSQAQCTLIEEQRLLRVAEDRKQGKPLFKRVVEDYAEKIRTLIKDVLGAYAEHSQSLDRSFPRRVVEALEKPSPDPSDISKKLNDLERRRDELYLAGLLEKESSINRFDPSKLDRKDVVQVLSVYAADTESKLEKFSDINKKISLFEELINAHLVRKSARISKDAGLVLQTDGGEMLDPAALSSGEQHLLVLFYELIFGGFRPNHLVMIDEPELSLHPAWQLRFIDDLERIREVNKIDFVLATHSPQIIGGKWALTRELSVRGEP